LAQQLANPPQKNQKRPHASITVPGAVTGDDGEGQVGKRPRGRPKGSKTKKKTLAEDGGAKEGEAVMAP